MVAGDTAPGAKGSEVFTATSPAKARLVKAALYNPVTTIVVNVSCSQRKREHESGRTLVCHTKHLIGSCPGMPYKYMTGLMFGVAHDIAVTRHISLNCNSINLCNWL
jgi:hypothetical protein